MFGMEPLLLISWFTVIKLLFRFLQSLPRKKEKGKELLKEGEGLRAYQALLCKVPGILEHPGSCQVAGHSPGLLRT